MLLNNDMIKKVIELVKQEGLDPVNVEVVIDGNEEIANITSGVIPYDIPYWQDGLNYWMQIKYNRKWYQKDSYGILEVVFDLGKNAICFIRDDMTIGEQLSVLIHALGHAHILNKNSIRFLYENDIIRYVSGSNTFRKLILDLESEYGYKHIEEVMDLAFYLGIMTGQFEDDNDQIIESAKKYLGEGLVSIENTGDVNNNKKSIVLSMPQKTETDLLNFFAEKFPNTPNYVRDIFRIFRSRMLYIRSIEKIKILHEGFATFITHLLFPKIAFELGISSDEVIRARTTHPIFSNIDQELQVLEYILNVLREEVQLSGNTTFQDILEGKEKIIINLNGLEKIYFLLLDIFLKVINDPYVFGFIYMKRKHEEGINVIELVENISDAEIKDAVNGEFVASIFSEYLGFIRNASGLLFDLLAFFYQNFYRNISRVYLSIEPDAIDIVNKKITFTSHDAITNLIERGLLIRLSGANQDGQYGIDLFTQLANYKKYLLPSDYSKYIGVPAKNIKLLDIEFNRNVVKHFRYRNKPINLSRLVITLDGVSFSNYQPTPLQLISIDETEFKTLFKALVNEVLGFTKIEIK
ncbi:MAG: SpoVR family protein [Candidatus Micrarchaeia archaeon]